MYEQHLSEARKTLLKHQQLKPIILNLEPIPLWPSGNVFRELVKNIVYQQISYKAADTIYSRFLNLMPKEEYQPQNVLKTASDTLSSAGLSRQKTAYIINIAEYFEENKLYDFNWDNLSDHEIIQSLTQIKGVGVWTVKMILIFELMRTDVWPGEDLAIQHVMKELFALKSSKRQLLSEMDKIADAWKPFRSIAGLYLWSYRRSQYENAK